MDDASISGILEEVTKFLNQANCMPKKKKSLLKFHTPFFQIITIAVKK